MHLVLQIGAAFFTVLVQPVRSYPFFGQMVHGLSTDLNLDRRAIRADQ